MVTVFVQMLDLAINANTCILLSYVYINIIRHMTSDMNDIHNNFKLNII